MAETIINKSLNRRSIRDVLFSSTYSKASFPLETSFRE